MSGNLCMLKIIIKKHYHCYEFGTKWCLVTMCSDRRVHLYLLFSFCFNFPINVHWGLWKVFEWKFIKVLLLAWGAMLCNVWNASERMKKELWACVNDIVVHCATPVSRLLPTTLRLTLITLSSRKDTCMLGYKLFASQKNSGPVPLSEGWNPAMNNVQRPAH